MRLSIKKNYYWKRADISKLRELVNEKSNTELAEIFNVSISKINKAMVKFNIRRDPEFQKEYYGHLAQEKTQ